MRVQPLQGLHLHLDPASGIAGDMVVAALVDAGVPPAVVIDGVAAIGVRGLRVRFESRRRGAYVGRGFVVEEPRSRAGRASSRKRGAVDRGHVHDDEHAHAHDHDHANDHAHEHTHDDGHDHSHGHVHDDGASSQKDNLRDDAHDHHARHGHRDYADIRRLLRRAKLDPDAKALAEEIFARLAEVEADLHGASIQRVTFHEVGAFDSIADIVGVSAAIAWLRPLSIGSTSPVLGTGRVHTAHGIVPVPAPATAELLRGIPVVFDGPGELTTPTGAAVLASVVDSFGPPPPLRIVGVGYGAGSRELSDRANVLRVILGEPIGQASVQPADAVLVMETNIDDMSGQLLAALFDALFAAGALDVWSTAITMKKGRPAQKVSALVDHARAERVERAFFLNSTTLGIRTLPVSRATLARSTVEVGTPFGPVRIKVAGLEGRAIGAQPEFEDCRRAALAAGVPVRRVWAAAVAAAAVLTPVAATPQGTGGKRTGGRKRNPGVGGASRRRPS